MVLRLWQRNRSVNCDGTTRRNFLQIGALGLGGLSLGDLGRHEAHAAHDRSRRKSVILYWLDGGPTHIETYDPKPDAPSEYRGPLGTIRTCVPGIQLSELLVRHATVMDRVSLLRSVGHKNGDHFAAAHWMMTGFLGSNASNQDPQYPSMGSVISRVCGPKSASLPSYVAVPQAATVGLNPGYNSAAFLGSPYNPFQTGDNPNNKNFQVRNLALPGGVTAERLDDRSALLKSLDQVKRRVDSSNLTDGLDRFNAEALELVTGESARKAFDINTEPDDIRDRYGRNTYGQSALLARRLVEAGVRFVTIHNGGWDHHSNIGNGMKSRLPTMDQSIGTLIEDLSDRGLLEDTMVCVMGEFGRTPRVNGTAGRDHWGNVMSVLLGGGGLAGGQIVGASSAKGEFPNDRPIQPADILATIYHQLSIPLDTHFLNHAGRPIAINNGGVPIGELI